MENYKVVFLQTALDDLEEIVLYIAKDSKNSAIKLRDKIVECASQLQTFPKLGLPVPDRKIGESGFRMLIVQKYLLFYKIYGDEINIMHILHGARDYPMLFSKIDEEDENNS